MENRAYAIAVGLFTIFSGLALLFAFWWLSGTKANVTEYVIISDRPVSGLSSQAAVKFRGVDVGKVSGISLDPAAQTSIMIRISVTDSLQLSKKSYAELRARGVTGLSYIDLNDTSKGEPRLPAGATIPLRPSFTDNLIERGPELVSELETLLKNGSGMTTTANNMLNKIDVENLNKTIVNLEHTTSRLDPLLSKIDPLLNSASTTFNRVSGMMSEQRQQQLSDTLLSVQKTADAARPLLGELKETATDLRGIGHDIADTTSQLSDTLRHDTLPSIYQLTEDLDRDTRHFDQLIEMLVDNPQSLLLGNPIARPGPGEAGFNSNP